MGPRSRQRSLLLAAAIMAAVLVFTAALVGAFYLGKENRSDPAATGRSGS
ncbi:MAG: hypothetical protein K2X82_06905 [Gemmataceae bacterium]|nr:hypothetical protein [Gemmataceae bacterium]